MAEHIQLITLEVPLSPPTCDDVVHNIVPQNVASPSSEDGFVGDIVLPDMASPTPMEPLIEEVVATDESTPLHDTAISEGLCTTMLGSSCSAIPRYQPERSGQQNVAHGTVRRVLFSDDGASSST